MLKIRVNGDIDQDSADRYNELGNELIDLRCTLAGILDIKADTGARCDRYTPDLTVRISSATETILRQLTIIGQLPPGRYDFVDLAGWQTAYKGADGRVIVTKDGESWTVDLTPARAPRNLEAEATDADIVLSWQMPKAASGEVTGYQVLRRRPDQGETVLRVLVEDTGSPVTTWTDTGVEPGVRYTYRVKAVRVRELSDVSNARSLRALPAVNTAAVGAPTITGTLQVGAEATASTSGISDVDGLANAHFAYQWIRADGDISGATGSTYTMVATDEDERLKVRISFSDDAGNAESLTSAAMAPVWPAPANPPLEDGEEELLSATMTLGWHQFPLWVAGYGRVRGESFGEMDATSFEDGGATYTIDAFLVNSRGVFGLATGSTQPDASGLVAYWNGYRISGLEAYTSNGGKSPPMLMGRTPQPSTEYSRYEGGASDGIRVAVSLRRAGPPDESPPLTASFVDVPSEHDGESAFTFRIAFSEPLSWMNGRRLREDVVAVAGGRATAASRVDRRRDLWKLTVEPHSPADVTVTLAAGAACGTPAAVCTKDGQALSETISATVAGPPASAPDKPTGLEATTTHGSVTLTWDDPGDDSITGYVILRRVRVNDTGGDFDVLVADTGTAATTYTDNTVAASTTYTYRIKAINEARDERAFALVPHRHAGGPGVQAGGRGRAAGPRTQRAQPVQRQHPHPLPPGRGTAPCAWRFTTSSGSPCARWSINVQDAGASTKVRIGMRATGAARWCRRGCIWCACTIRAGCRLSACST